MESAVFLLWVIVEEKDEEKNGFFLCFGSSPAYGGLFGESGYNHHETGSVY